MEREAILWERLEDSLVHCFLCAHECRIRPGRTGVCGVRENREGTLYTLVYGEVVALNVDPIEKKPLFHFLPGSQAFSIATVGCNLRCRFCQNADISQASRGKGWSVHGEPLAPERAVELALEYKCASIAYTYTEPTIFMEYALAIAPLAVEAGLANVFVTNGFMTPQAREAIGPYLHAANVDLKAFRDHYYRELCGARLQPVLDTIQDLYRRGVETEVTTLIVPEENDSPDELGDIAGFLASISPDIPWHLSRFFPTYRLTERPPTPLETLRRAAEIGRNAGLRYVYLGNVPGEPEDTLCPQCEAPVIRRTMYQTTVEEEADRCPACAARLPVVTAVHTPASRGEQPEQ
jgi:pyruvate formate lyase activating enzyme